MTQAIVDTDEDDEVREVKIAKEVKRDDVLLRFACGDVHLKFVVGHWLPLSNTRYMRTHIDYRQNLNHQMNNLTSFAYGMRCQPLVKIF